MKILNSVKTIFNDKQKAQLEDLLFKKVGEGNIKWRDVFVDQLKRRLPNLLDGLKLSKLPYFSIINADRINEQFEDTILTLASISSEAESLSQILSKHEMFRKDDVKTFFNLSRNYMDMVNNEIKDYKTNNITVQNSIIELIPTSILDYPIKSVETEYMPDNALKRFGNDPTPENLTPGTDKDYWLSEIITSIPMESGAKIKIGFNGIINFNILYISTAGKYPVTISDVERYEEGEWISIPYIGKPTEKIIELTMVDDGGKPCTYTSEFVRITLVQERSEFQWKVNATNEREILSYDTERLKTFLSLTYNNTFDLYVEKTYNNVYSYIFGLYYVRVMYKAYDGDMVGTFYSRKFGVGKKFNRVTIKSEEYMPMIENSIEYKLLLSNGNYANYEFINKPANVYQIDSTDVTQNAAPRFATGSTACGMDTDGTYLWIANTSSDTVSKVNLSTDRIVSLIPVGSTPFDVIYSSGYIYVSCTNDNKIYQIDASTDATESVTFYEKMSPKNMTVDNTYLYVANFGNNSITRIDKAAFPASGYETLSQDIGLGPYDMVIGNDYLWVTNSLSNSISKVDLAAWEVDSVIDMVGSDVRGIDYTEDGGNKYLWVASHDMNNIIKVDIEPTVPTKETINLVTGTDFGPENVMYYNGYIWVTNSISDTVSRVNISTNEVDSIPVGDQPMSMIMNGTNLLVSHNIRLKPDMPVKLLDIFNENENITNISGNAIKLKHFPINNDIFSCYVNGVDFGKPVDNFETGKNQCILKDSHIFISQTLTPNDRVQISYDYYTDYINVQILLSSNTVYSSVDCPKIKGFDVQLT